MKRKFALILVCLLTITFFSFYGCGGSNNATDENVTDKSDNVVESPDDEQDYSDDENDNKPEETPDAYEQLSVNEKFFFDAFKNKISLFKNPASVKIINIVGSYYNQSYFDFSISAQNSFGATISEGYLLFTKLWTAPDSEEIKYGNYGNTALAGMMMSYSDFSDTTFFSAYAKLSIIDPDTQDCDNYTYSVSKINNAIKEYQVENGWL